jgi:hypothetical protein
VRDSVRTQLVLLAFAIALHQAAIVGFELGGVGGWPYLLSRSCWRRSSPRRSVRCSSGSAGASLVSPLFGMHAIQPGKTV